MPSLSGRFNTVVGAIINVGVLPCGQLPAPSIHITTFPALIDTGATATCISLAIVQTLGLLPVGIRPMVSATQSVPVNVYLTDLALPFGNAGMVIPSIQVMEFNTTPNSPFQMLIGRDILCKGVFTFSFDGHFTFSL